jgi:hypothetical protein
MSGSKHDKEEVIDFMPDKAVIDGYFYEKPQEFDSDDNDYNLVNEYISNYNDVEDEETKAATLNS